MARPAIVASAVAQQAAIKRTVIRTIDYPAGYTRFIGGAVHLPSSASFFGQ
jgi:hypothetical protein